LDSSTERVYDIEKQKYNCPGLSMSAAELFSSFTDYVAYSVVNKNNTINSKTKQQTKTCSSTCRTGHASRERKLQETIMQSRSFVNTEIQQFRFNCSKFPMINI